MRRLRAFGILLGPTVLLCSACTVKAEAPSVHSVDMNCTVTGEKHAGASVDEICASFARALEESGTGMDVELEVSALSPRTARAVAKGHDGAVLMSRDFDVMDAELNPAIWRDFAGQFARELTALGSR